MHARDQHYDLELDLFGWPHVLDPVRVLVADSGHQYLEHFHVLEVVCHVREYHQQNQWSHHQAAQWNPVDALAFC